MFFFCASVSTMAFDPVPQTVQVHPMSKSGSTVGKLKLWINKAILDSSTGLRIWKYFSYIHHNFSDQIVSHPFSSHKFLPVFEISPSEDPSISGTYFNSTTLSHLTAPSMERCAVTGSTKRYVAISLDLRLLSDSLYHLGQHNIIISAVLHMPNNSYIIFETILRLRVEAG